MHLARVLNDAIAVELLNVPRRRVQLCAVRWSARYRVEIDPALKLACGRLPDTGRDLCSQPTVSRWENAPSLRDLIRLMGVMVDLYCASYTTSPAAVTLDIDDTVDVVHGHQQLSLFNAHYDERCFLPIHVYDTAEHAGDVVAEPEHALAADMQRPMSAPDRIAHSPSVAPSR